MGGPTGDRRRFGSPIPTGSGQIRCYGLFHNSSMPLTPVHVSGDDRTARAWPVRNGKSSSSSYVGREREREASKTVSALSESKQNSFTKSLFNAERHMPIDMYAYMKREKEKRERVLTDKTKSWFGLGALKRAKTGRYENRKRKPFSEASAHACARHVIRNAAKPIRYLHLYPYSLTPSETTIDGRGSRPVSAHCGLFSGPR